MDITAFTAAVAVSDLDAAKGSPAGASGVVPTRSRADLAQWGLSNGRDLLLTSSSRRAPS